MKPFSIGVDLGGTNMRIAAVDEDGKQLDLVAGEAGVSRGPSPVIDEMCARIQELAGKLAGDHELVGVGIGVPGTIDIATGTIAKAVNLPGWDEYPVKEEIRRRLRKPVVLQNDGKCAALGEHWLGAGRGVNDMCMLTLGTGVGGAFIFGGAIWHGMMGMAGEIGHMTVKPDWPKCPCGNRGCLELFASAKGIRRMAIEAASCGSAPAWANAVKTRPESSAEIIYEYARQGDVAAQEIFATVGSSLGIVLAGLVNALNLPLFVIAGGVSSAWDVFSPALFREVRMRSVVFHSSDPEANPAPSKKTIIARTRLGGQAGLLGAARLPLLPTA